MPYLQRRHGSSDCQLQRLVDESTFCDCENEACPRKVRLGEHPNEFLVAPSFATNYGIVLSNSCDVESEDKNPLEFVTIGAVLPITSLPDQGKHGDLRRNQMVRFFHLPADNEAGFPESYVHFGLLALVRQEAMIAAKRLRVLTLDHPFREDLGHRFGEIFSRIARP